MFACTYKQPFSVSEFFFFFFVGRWDLEHMGDL